MEKSKSTKKQAMETYQRLNTTTGKYCLFDSKTNDLISEKKSEGPYKNVRIEETPKTQDQSTTVKEEEKTASPAAASASETPAPATESVNKTEKVGVPSPEKPAPKPKKNQSPQKAPQDGDGQPENQSLENPKKTSENWLKETSCELLTKAGWNGTPPDFFKTVEITKSEFDARLALCNVRQVVKLN